MIIKWLNSDFFDYNRSSLSSESDCECMLSSALDICMLQQNSLFKFLVQLHKYLGTLLQQQNLNDLDGNVSFQKSFIPANYMGENMHPYNNFITITLWEIEITLCSYTICASLYLNTHGYLLRFHTFVQKIILHHKVK